MSLGSVHPSQQFCCLCIGNKLQPVDVLKGARSRTPHQDAVHPSPYRSEGAMAPFTGDLAHAGTLQGALEVRGPPAEGLSASMAIQAA